LLGPFPSASGSHRGAQADLFARHRAGRPRRTLLVQNRLTMGCGASSLDPVAVDARAIQADAGSEEIRHRPDERPDHEPREDVSQSSNSDRSLPGDDSELSSTEDEDSRPEGVAEQLDRDGDAHDSRDRRGRAHRRRNGSRQRVSRSRGQELEAETQDWLKNLDPTDVGGMPSTPVGRARDRFKYFCPFCFHYFTSMYRSTCCNNYCCVACAVLHVHHKTGIWSCTVEKLPSEHLQQVAREPFRAETPSHSGHLRNAADVLGGTAAPVETAESYDLKPQLRLKVTEEVLSTTCPFCNSTPFSFAPVLEEDKVKSYVDSPTTAALLARASINQNGFSQDQKHSHSTPQHSSLPSFALAGASFSNEDGSPVMSAVEALKQGEQLSCDLTSLISPPPFSSSPIQASRSPINERHLPPPNVHSANTPHFLNSGDNDSRSNLHSCDNHAPPGLESPNQMGNATPPPSLSRAELHSREGLVAMAIADVTNPRRRNEPPLHESLNWPPPSARRRLLESRGTIRSALDSEAEQERSRFGATGELPERNDDNSVPPTSRIVRILRFDSRPGSRGPDDQSTGLNLGPFPASDVYIASGVVRQSPQSVE